MTLDNRLPDPYKKLYKNAAAVTPSDVADLVPPAEALYCGNASGGSALRIITSGNQTVDLAAQEGRVIPIRTTRVLSTGTTVAAIIALW